MSRRHAVLLAPLVALTLAATPAAVAAGDHALQQVGVVRATDLPQLGAPYGTALSPNGRFLFSVSGDATISSFRRDAREKLHYVDTATLAAAGEYLAVSPDGEHLYVAQDGGIDVVKIGNHGGLAPVRSYPDTADTVLVSPFGVDVSADGKFVYVSDSSAAGAINVFRRSATSGKLRFASVLDTPGLLTNPYVLAESVDGKQLYASQCGGDADLVVLQRNAATGGLSSPRTVEVGSSSETCSWGIGVGRRSVVVSGYTTGVVQGYSRSRKGRLTPFDAYTDSTKLQGAYYLSRPGGGSTVFVEGYDSSTLVRLHVADSGNVRPLGVTTSAAIDGPFGMSADRTGVYVLSYLSSTLVAFRRR